ncbi:XRE family transcriptional regulator [Bacillus thuringiensis]|nr:XRE family transcriptional regulator [Bacillus cereus]PFE31106.1 XRE family transcriptional regulator [Bacillus thuringiensis]PEV07275.1 XRE family transcriptional regulator [Bacillus cereus]PFT99212.1 XRE family transcriptional regulator [Bacillus thuringiensis]PGM64338.1 XRE family transcriptional regulator [Bacillus cereus]
MFKNNDFKPSNVRKEVITSFKVGRCRIPELCKKNGITQAQLAKKVGIVPQSITDYVSLRNLPNVERACNIASILHCDIKDLYEWDTQ